MTKRLQNINVIRASDLKTFRTFAAKLRHNMHDVLKLYFGLRAKCLWRMIKELGIMAGIEPYDGSVFVSENRQIG